MQWGDSKFAIETIIQHYISAYKKKQVIYNRIKENGWKVIITYKVKSHMSKNNI